MNKLLEYKGYFGTVEFSKSDNIFHGKVMGIDSLIMYEGDSTDSLKKGFVYMIDEYIVDCENKGVEPEKTQFINIEDGIAV